MKEILVPNDTYHCQVSSIQNYEHIIHLPSTVGQDSAITGILNFIVNQLKEIKDKIQKFEDNKAITTPTTSTFHYIRTKLTKH